MDEGTLYAYFSNTLNSEDSDTFNRNRAKVSTPKPIKNLYKLFEKCTPEEKYYSAIRLLQEDPIDILERNDIFFVHSAL